MRTMLHMALEHKWDKKPKSTPKEIELRKCHHYICFEKSDEK